MENPAIERAGWSDEDVPVKEERIDEDYDSADYHEKREEDEDNND